MLLVLAAVIWSCGGQTRVDSENAGGGGGSAGEDGGASSTTGGAGASLQPPCWRTDKWCSSVCLSKSDPASGCGTPSCSPCDLPNATAGCGSEGECSIQACVLGWYDCDGLRENGCEAKSCL